MKAVASVRAAVPRLRMVSPSRPIGVSKTLQSTPAWEEGVPTTATHRLCMDTFVQRAEQLAACLTGAEHAVVVSFINAITNPDRVVPEISDLSRKLIAYPHETGDASILIEYLAADSELWGRVVDVVQRCTYGHARQRSLVELAGRFGLCFVRDVALGLSLDEALYTGTGFWRRVSGTPVELEDVACRATRFALRLTERPIMGEVFLAAFLREIGRAAACQQLMSAENRVGLSLEVTLAEHLLELAGVPVGLDLALRQGLPPIVSCAIAVNTSMPVTEIPSQSARVLGLVESSLLAH